MCMSVLLVYGFVSKLKYCILRIYVCLRLSCSHCYSNGCLEGGGFEFPPQCLSMAFVFHIGYVLVFLLM